jgi:hypothetical protein
MKKSLIGLALLASVTTASALDFGVGYNRNITNDVDGYGLSASQSWGNVSLTAAVDRFEVGNKVSDHVTVVAGYTVAKVWGIAIEGQVGATYIQSDTAKDGLTSVVGVGASMPLTKSLALVADARRTIGFDDMKVHNGTGLGLGIRYSF